MINPLIWFAIILALAKFRMKTIDYSRLKGGLKNNEKNKKYDEI